MVIALALLACMPEDQVLAHYDRDGDGFLHPEAAAQGVEGPFDCDDADDAVHPDAPEVCDGIDNDCDDAIDDGGAAPRTFFLDGDGDGFGTESTVEGCEMGAGQSTQSGDCDDTSDAIFPGAEELWYDGLDQDCLGGDDYDADGDGHTSEDHAGDDCDDEDAAVYEGAPEGWSDIGVDNDCDGTLDDRVVLDADDVSVIDGVAEGEAFGKAALVLPAGWASDEPVLVVGAPAWESYRGAAYAFEASALTAADTSDAATWSWFAPEPTGAYGDTVGNQMGWAGDTERPVTLVAAMSAASGRGTVYGLTPGDFGSDLSASTFAITGDVDGILAGYVLASGTDLDGDGQADVVVSASFDSRVASGAGTVGVFYDPASLAGDLSYADADVRITLQDVGGNLAAFELGDADGDGADDLSLGCACAGDVGGLLYTDIPSSGTFDANSGAVAQFLWSRPVAVVNLDTEPEPELLTLGGYVRQYDLPVSGTVWPGDAVAESAFADATGDWVGSAIPKPPFGGAQSIVASSHTHDSDRGWVAIDELHWATPTTYDEARFIIEGERAGDRFGYWMGLMDFDADGVDDLILTAPDADGLSSNGGAVYLVPRPK